MKKTRATASPKKRPTNRRRKVAAKKPKIPTVRQLAATAAEVCKYPAIEHKLVLNALEYLADADYELERAAAVYLPTSKEITNLRAGLAASISQIRAFAQRNAEIGMKEGWLK